MHPVRRALPAALATGAVLTLAGCSGSSGASPAPTRTPSPTPPPGPALAQRHFLGVGFLVPATWRGRRSRASSTDGTVVYNAPDGRGRVTVEVNGCVACVDEGDVTHALRNNVPDPGAVIDQYDPVSRHRVSTSTIAFRAPAPAAYASPAVLTVRKVNGEITGYAVIEAILPKPDAATAARIVASLSGRGVADGGAPR